MCDIPATVAALPADAALPAGATAWRNDYDAFGWDGPCPPPGPAHRYVFTLYALDVAALQLPVDWPKARARELIEGHALASASLTGTFGR